MESALTLAEVKALQDAVEEVYVDEIIQHWVVELVRATRDLETVAIGASVRGTLALERAARAWALLNGRDYVVPEDVESLFLPVIGHRVLFTPTFLVEVRKLGREPPMARLLGQCLRLAPKPEAQLGGEVLPLELRRLEPVATAS